MSNLRVVFEFALFSGPLAKPRDGSSLSLAHLIVLCLPIGVHFVSNMYAACHMPLEGREFAVSLDDGLAVMSETVSLMCCWDQSAWGISVGPSMDMELCGCPRSFRFLTERFRLCDFLTFLGTHY